MIDPKEVFIGIPCKERKPDVLTMLGLIMCALEGRYQAVPYVLVQNSDIAATRMCMARAYLASGLEWLYLIDDDIGFTVADFDLLSEGDELAVCAEYRKKDERGYYVATWGLGFARVHRSVFEEMDALTRDDGTPWVESCIYGGDFYRQYFPAGINAAKEYRGEDHGFWTYVHMTGAPVRLENRTSLIHVGMTNYRYDPSRQPEPQYGSVQAMDLT